MARAAVIVLLACLSQVWLVDAATSECRLAACPRTSHLHFTRAAPFLPLDYSQ